MPKNKPPIDYTSRDFSSIRQELLDYARKYYPNTFRDFNEASFGLMSVENLAYIGDVLSFYLDYSVSEAFFDSSVEYGNVVRHAKERGYDFNRNPSSYGYLSFYLLVPAMSNGLGPDMSYAPVLRRQSTFSSTGGSSFMLLEDVDFSDVDTSEIVPARIDQNTGIPSYYAVKTYGAVVSGEMKRITKEIGNFERFLRVDLGTSLLAEIISVFDSEGHEYFQVDNLAQDTVYRPILNRGADSARVPNILKPVPVPRRFSLDKTNNTTYMQFGYGSDNVLEEANILDPANTALQIHGKEYITNSKFDPTKMISSDKFGISPSNTTLVITYRENSNDNVNASVGTVTRINRPIFKFQDPASLSLSTRNFVLDSLEVTNEDRIVGDVSLPTVDEIKKLAKNYFFTQDRCVTSEDYKAMAYNMPNSLGKIKRVNVYQDNNSFKRNLNLYVLSEDANGNLAEASLILKDNLRNWLSSKKMTNDTIDILDAKIVNFGVNFELIAERDRNRYDVLQRAINKLKREFLIKMDIGEPIMISSFYNILNEVNGVEDVVNVEVVPRIGSRYATTNFNFNLYTSSDGRLVESFENIIFELKFPDQDIRGSVR